ncbi:MAG TPA: hypothetical protein ENN43_00465, partial [bacterium]|nr:hypothetical protein [bacterium]
MFIVGIRRDGPCARLKAKRVKGRALLKTRRGQAPSLRKIVCIRRDGPCARLKAKRKKAKHIQKHHKKVDNMTLFKNKYRVETTRLQGWDYSGRGYYYITICTKDKKKLFGCLENNRVILSGAGFKALELWQRIPDEFLNIEIKEYVFMPEHMHALIKIKEEGGKSLSEVVGAYKSRSAKAIGLLAGVKWNEVWQKGFYD